MLRPVLTPLNTIFNSKQDNLTAGTGIDITNNIISTIKNKTGSGSAQFDNSAYCLFEKITVSSKGLILDELQNCASYYALTNTFEAHPFSGYDDIIGQSSDYKLPWTGQSIVYLSYFFSPYTY